jgi:hypothetical protein
MVSRPVAELIDAPVKWCGSGLWTTFGPHLNSAGTTGGRI